MAKDIFIGYADLETMLQAQPKDRSLYVMLIGKPGKLGKYGFALETMSVEVQDIAPQGVRYCYLKVATVETMGGAPFNEETYKARWERAKSAYQVIKDWLTEHGYTLEEATIAFPKDYMLMEGWAGFLKYDKGTDRFLRGDTDADARGEAGQAK